MDESALVVVAAMVLGYGLVARKLTSLSVSGPMVFLLLGALFGNDGFALVAIQPSSSLVKILAELTLVIVLFSDAARVELRMPRTQASIPGRMLSIGMILTIVLGTVCAYWIFPGLDIWAAALLAVILTPTDAALGQPIMTNPRVPIRIRQAINIESGLNDGIAVPFIAIFTAGAIAAEGISSQGSWLEFAAKQIGFGAGVGVLLGVGAGRLIHLSVVRRWMGEAFLRISVLALAIGAFALAELVEGNGLIAAFVAGMAFGNTTKHVNEELFEFTEEEGQLLVLLTFFVFGVAFLSPAFEEIDIRTVIFVVLVLTVVRMVPIALSLVGLNLRGDTILILGWFGPRGLASLVFALDLLEGEVEDRVQMFNVAAIAIAVSVVVHGLSAQPLAKWYARRVGEIASEPDLPEMVEVPELPTRSPVRPPTEEDLHGA
jgi:NhaP-type Na+/H+ or K+/H+ antiporter